MMTKLRKYCFGLIGLILPAFCMAAADLGQSAAAGIGLEGDLVGMIANIIKTGLTLVGAVALAMIVYGGFLYISAAGDESQIKKAKTVLIYAIIGIIVIGLAYALVAFVLGAFGGGGGINGG
jgi:hypothetical protein